MLVALFSAITVSASDDVVLSSGSLSELVKAAPADVAIVWDYSNATLEGKNVDAFLQEKGSDWVSGYPEELNRAQTVFEKRLLKEKKLFNVVEDQSKAKYIITIKVGDFYYGSTGMSIVIGFGAGNSSFKGTIEVTRQGESTPIAVLRAVGVPGSGMGNEARRIDAYKNLSKWVVKYVKKAK